MDAERLAAAVQGGELSQVAEKAAMAELAGRVLADDMEFGIGARSRVAGMVDRVAVVVASVVLAVWLARTLGLFT